MEPRAQLAEKRRPVKLQLPSSRVLFRAPGGENLRRFAWAFCRNSTCLSAVDAHCTTERHKTHKTESGKVVYPWHPFYKCEVRVHGGRNRRGAIVLICSAGDETKVPLEVPVWMFDSALCCSFRSAQSGHVTFEALRCLRKTLNSIASVIEAQHQSTFTGGSDAQAYESSDTTRSVSIDSSKGESASSNRPQTGSFVGTAISSIHKRKSGRTQPTGVRP